MSSRRRLNCIFDGFCFLISIIVNRTILMLFDSLLELNALVLYVATRFSIPLSELTHEPFKMTTRSRWTFIDIL